MPANVMLLVLLGAALHASWNGLVKSGRDKFLDAVLVAAGAGLIAASVLPFLPVPAAPSWPYAAASVPLQVVYFFLLAAAYQEGDLSLTYPLMRGTAPLLVAVTGSIVFGGRLSPGSWAGVLLICAGVLALTPSYRTRRRAMCFALGNAVVIAGYTLLDSRGVRLSGNAAAYTMWVFFLTALPLLAWTIITRPREFRMQLAMRGHVGLAGGVCALGSYGVVLWAMTQAPVAPVAALRETAILFGMVLAALMLKERFGAGRLVAAAVIATGAVVLRLA